MSSTDTSRSVARLPFREPAIAVAHFIVSADVERSRRFYTEVLGGVAVATRPVTYIALANSWIIINVGGGPTAKCGGGRVFVSVDRDSPRWQSWSDPTAQASS